MLTKFQVAKNAAAEMQARKAARARVAAQKVIAWYRDPSNAPACPRIAIQYNNSKIKDTDTTAFLIFSLPAVMTCPGANTGCLSACYARRDERFPSVRKYRIANLAAARSRDFVPAMIAAIKAALYTKRGALRRRFIGKKIVFRLHESGDFFSVAYMRAWFAVARELPFIQFFTYTKSFKIYAACVADKPDNFTVRASLWENATTAEEKALAARLGMPVYTVLKDTTGADYVCDCAGGCGACGCACAVAALAEIIAAIH